MELDPKSVARRVLGAPGIRHGLRWFINQRGVPRSWRELVHRKLAKRARFGDRPFSYVTPGGVELRFLHHGTANYLYWRNEYEPETTALFCALAERAGVILDIGAADGVYAILAAAANPEARILAFEPGDGASRTVARNVELNLPITRNVELHSLALGATDTDATLYVAGETGGTSSLNPAFRVDRREQAVKVRRGEALLAECGIARVDLIKIDTESTEPDVLRGLGQRLSRDLPDVICEVLPGRTERPLEELLRPLGYRFYWISSRGLVAQERLAADQTYRQPNFLFTVRADAELPRTS